MTPLDFLSFPSQNVSIIPSLSNPKSLFGFIADNRDAQGPVLAAVALAA